MDLRDRAAALLELHAAPELLVLPNVWDVYSATTVAGVSGCRALATASHSIAGTFGYPDGEHIPFELMLDMVGRIADAVDVPVTADLEAGYGDAGATIARAIEAGIVGANLEDQMKPLDESVAAVAAAVAAGEAAGIPFVLNARTDAFLRAAERDPHDVVADAIERGRAFLEAGAACVFVPGMLDLPTIERLVAGIGDRKVSVIGFPGTPSHAELQQAGVARISYGPLPQRLAMEALARAAANVLTGGTLSS